MAAAGCTKHPDVSNGTDSSICLSVTEAGTTKALLDNGTFKTPGNRIQVYDFVTDGDNTSKHIDAYAGPDVESNSPMHEYGKTWPFEDKDGNPVSYQWVPGTHKFFGWLAKDANSNPAMTAEEFFGTGFEFDEKDYYSLSIPAKDMLEAGPKLDFMYSDIHITEPVNTGVNMNFFHLFTAFSIGIENSTSAFVKIEEFEIKEIPSKNSATISFNGEQTVVEYGDLTDYKDKETGKYNTTIALETAPYEISSKGIRANIFNGSTTQEFRMLWPVGAEFLHSTEKSTINEDGTIVYPESWKMYIKYSTAGQTYEKYLNFPDVSWDAGKKYHMTIVLADKMVELKTEVKPWEYEEQTIDYTNEGVSMSSGGALAWDRTVSSVDDAAKMVSIVNAQPAKAMFTIQTPVGGSWIVSLTGDVNAFEVSPSTGIIDSQTATIHVRPLVASPTRDYKVQLKFTVRRSDGRMIAADNMIQGGGIYTVVLPRNN